MGVSRLYYVSAAGRAEQVRSSQEMGGNDAGRMVRRGVASV